MLTLQKVFKYDGVLKNAIFTTLKLSFNYPVFNPTTLLNEVSREGAFSCARDRHGDDAVACRPRTVGPHPPGRL
jgi:hypothetical protein